MPKELFSVGWSTSPDNIQTSVKEGVEACELPLSKDGQSYIKFENITFEQSKNTTPADIKEAKALEKSVLTSIFADVVRYDSGVRKVLDHNLMIGKFPQLLEGHNTFMVTGSEYNLVNQPRRKSSVFVYSPTGSAGDAVADFNLAKGRNFDISLDAASGKVAMKIGTSLIALRVLLETLDIMRYELVKVTDETFAKEHWDTVEGHLRENNFRKLYSKLYEFKREDVKSIPLDTIITACKEYFEQTAVNSETTKYLFDYAYTKIDHKFMLDILDKFYKVNTNKDAGVDPDDLYYQKLYPPNLLFKDRIEKITPEIASMVKHKIKLGHSPDKIFRNIFTKYLVSLVNASDLSRLDPQYNPIGIYAASTKLSPLGMGGISDVQAVTRAKRGTHSSYFGVIDPTSTAQGQNIGIQLNLTDDVRIDKEGEIYIPLKNERTNKIENVLIASTYDKKLALPRSEHDKVDYAMHRGKIIELSKTEKADYSLARDTSSMFSTMNQLVAFPQATQGNRSLMTSRQVTQAVPLKYGEAPYVEPINYEGVSTYRKIRKDLEKLLPFEAPVSGTISSVGNGEIIITDEANTKHKFSYHEHLPFATNTGVHQEPIVGVGDKVKEGQLIVKDSFTTDDGKLALGKNLTFAFAPYYGDNTEDGIAISESAAEKLTSLHYHTFSAKANDSTILNKEEFRKIFGTKYPEIDWEDYDEMGALKKGKKATYRQPILLVIEKRTPDDRLSTLGKISNKIIVGINDGSQLYDGYTEGKVVDSIRKNKFVSVTLVSEEKAKVGDKLTGMYGNKGTISVIMPNDKMLRSADGNPIDVVYSSTTVVSRIIPGPVYENALGKIVAKGKRSTYQVPVAKNPTKDDLYGFTKKELNRYGLNDKETVYDPIAGKNIDRPIAVGSMYMIKLLKGDKDVTARGVGPGYTYSGVPSKGGKEGAKSIGAMEFNALVAHNARAFLTDAGHIKSQSNPDYWKGVEMGILASPNAKNGPWEQTKGLLTAAGGYVTQTNDSISIAPLTDKITNALAEHRVIKTPALLNSKNLEPMKKGLFDPVTTGGVAGKLWAKYDLSDGIISPLLSDHIRLVLNMSAQEFKDWQINNSTADMKKQLKAIDIDNIIEELSAKSKNRDLSNSEIKKLRFLKNVKERGESLDDYVLTSIPIPPPVFRPMTKLPDGNVQVADLNLFYKDVMLANDALDSVKDTDFKTEAKSLLVNSIDAMIGNSDTNNIQLRRKNAKGILPFLGGKGSPKTGYVHSTLIKKNQDLSGRARIVADSSLNMDEIGLPEHLAWKVFNPHIMSKLRGMGMTPMEAAAAVTNHDDRAVQALQQVAGELNVLYNRAPTLAKESILAAKPIIINDTSIHLNLPATKPLNADFDGDAIMIHVPSTPMVSRTLEKLKLSANVFNDSSIGSLTIGFHTESILGLYQKSVSDPRGYYSAMREIIGPDHKIAIPANKKALNALLVELARDSALNITEVYDKIRKLGEKWATEIGSTVGIDDVKPLIKERDEIIAKFSKQLKSASNLKEKAAILQDAQNAAKSAARKHTGDLAMLVESGAKGSDMQLASIVLSPVLTYDPDKPLQTAELTPGSYAEGLNMRDFWLQNVKIKKDAAATALSIATPGMLSKLLIYNTNKEIIYQPDCGTKAGVYLGWNSKDILGRVIQENLPGMPRGTIITDRNYTKLPKRDIYVRSPRTCASPKGVCQKCYGTDSYWKFYDIGVNVGIRSSQAVTEPLAQAALDSKHGGRDITRDIGGGGLTALTNLFSSNSEKPYVATLSTQEDKVKSISQTKGMPSSIIMESGAKYKIHPEGEVIVQEGQHVGLGEKLTEGIIPYTDVTKLKGIKKGREVLISELKKLAGNNLNERIFDVIAKGAINQVEVNSAFDGYLPGDHIPYNTLVKLGEEKGLIFDKDKVLPGTSLAEELMEFSVGHKLTPSDLLLLANNPTIKTIKIFPHEIRVKPSIKSFYTSGMLDDDWVNNLGQKYIKKTITTAASEGKTSLTSSVSPMNKWLVGGKFNEDTPEY